MVKAVGRKAAAISRTRRFSGLGLGFTSPALQGRWGFQSGFPGLLTLAASDGTRIGSMLVAARATTRSQDHAGAQDLASMLFT